MKTMCPPGYHHNGSVATHAPGHYLLVCKLYSILIEKKKLGCQLLSVYIHVKLANKGA